MALLGVGCGPTMSLPDTAAGSTSSNGAPPDAAGGDADDGAGAFDPGDGAADSGGESSESSTGAPPFMDSDVVGVWLCTGDNDPFAMHIVDYTSPDQISGSVCADFTSAVDPLEWGPCATLTVHPIGGGPFLPIYAEVYHPMNATVWVVSAALHYDTASDTMEGTWLEPSDDEPLVVSCLRLE